MKKYTKEEIIDELAMNMCVKWAGYGTWEISSYIGNRDNKISFSEITHDEEDEKGIFDGEEYNDYANSDQAREDCERDGENYGEWYELVTHDSANEDNYESREQRDRRLARRIFDHNFDEPTAGDYIICNSGDENFYLLEGDYEREVFDDNMNYWLFGEVKWCEKIDEFMADVKKAEEE